jgi:hypothetical protein
MSSHQHLAICIYCLRLLNRNSWQLLNIHEDIDIYYVIAF